MAETTDSAGYSLGPVSDGGMDPRTAYERERATSHNGQSVKAEDLARIASELRRALRRSLRPNLLASDWQKVADALDQREELQKRILALELGIQAAWPYVHNNCTIDSVKKSISTLLVGDSK